MSTTINDFRNFFRPDKELVDFSARAQVEQTMALMDASLRAIGMEIALHVIDDITLRGLPNEYSQVLLNLLANAKDAVEDRARTHGRVDVEIRAQNGEGHVIVRDNGGGIPPEVMARIFDPFFSTRDAGTGTGLYLSKMIVERSMRGRIEVRNVTDGAEFSVICPLAELAR
jgi:signal transduction histidine kinase